MNIPHVYGGILNTPSTNARLGDLHPMSRMELKIDAGEINSQIHLREKWRVAWR